MDSNTNRPLSDDERRALRNRLMKSAINFDKQRRIKNTYLILAAAASFALIFGLFQFSFQQKEQSLQNFVSDSPAVDINSSDKVTIVLGEGENIVIDESSTVEYSSNGSNVKMGKGKSYDQNALIDKKPIFNTILVPYGKRTDVMLSDGTHVWINSGSRLVYPAIFKGKNREVYLEGEAIFEVTHNADKPFKVLSENQEIEVLGTVFNVSNYPEDEQMTTVLKSGSIKLIYNNDESKSFKITPGTLSSYNNKTSEIKKSKVNVDDYFGWREGYLSLKQQPLDYIASRLSRYYNVEIMIFDEKLSKETFSGKLDLKEDIHKVIDIISETTQMKIIKDKDNIILTN
tara:strand:+ start:7071 stop:8102 length:1032 start_codon:yes stop_codon:yes gene_type:complete